MDFCIAKGPHGENLALAENGTQMRDFAFSFKSLALNINRKEPALLSEFML